LDHGEPHGAQPEDSCGAATLHVAGVPHGTQAGPNEAQVPSWMSKNVKDGALELDFEAVWKI